MRKRTEDEEESVLVYDDQTTRSPSRTMVLYGEEGGECEEKSEHIMPPDSLPYPSGNTVSTVHLLTFSGTLG